MTAERKYYVKFSLLAYLVWILAFEAVGRFASTLPFHDPTSNLDRMIPLIPDFIWFYEICYLFPFLPLVLIKDFHRLNVVCLSMIFANAIAFAAYVAYPVALPRPELGNSWAELILKLEHAGGFQPGANKLPSLHVAFAWFVFVACRGQKVNKVGEVAIFITAVMITLSTLFLKQHIIIDAITGILLVMITWKLARYLYPLLTQQEADPRKALRVMLRKTGILTTCIAIFWFLLPFSLWSIGRLVERRWPFMLPDHALVESSGVLLIVTGLGFCAYSAICLIKKGKGLPVSHLPPVFFVNDGPYKFFRHPIYIGYSIAWAGFALLWASFWMLTLSLPVLVVSWWAYVSFYEEPALQERFGETYEQYRRETSIFGVHSVLRTSFASPRSENQPVDGKELEE
jgi:protein-S-isoprenylcysteine O-methyltransferase Ste14